jgi:glycine hydroxymethyltransferase
MAEIARVICIALSEDFEAEKAQLLERTRALMERYPLYPQLSAAPV